MQFSKKRDIKQGFASLSSPASSSATSRPNPKPSSPDHILHNDDFACYFRKILCLHIFSLSFYQREKA